MGIVVDPKLQSYRRFLNVTPVHTRTSLIVNFQSALCCTAGQTTSNSLFDLYTKQFEFNKSLEFEYYIF